MKHNELRDLFATQAMRELLAGQLVPAATQGSGGDRDSAAVRRTLAREAYALADAMLERRAMPGTHVPPPR